MAPSLSTTNTSSTPNQPGHWMVPEFGKPSVLKWEAFDPLSELSGTKVLVRILVAGLAGVDNIQRAGGLPYTKTPGFTPGHDFVGEIQALGDDVPKDINLSVGDRVAALSLYNAHATHIVLPYEELLPLMKNDDVVKICALPLNYMTSWSMLQHAGYDLKPGSSVLIGSASGGLGTAMAQLVKAFDMGIQLIGTTSPSKFEYLRSLGVTPIDRHAPDVVQQVLDLTNGQGVDVAYDAVCSHDSVKNSLAVVKKDIGRVVIVGVMNAIKEDGSGMEDDAHDILYQVFQPPLVDFYKLDVNYPKTSQRVEFYEIVKKVRSGKLEPIVKKFFRLSQAIEAHEFLNRGVSVEGKPMFIVDEKLAEQLGVGVDT